MYQTEQKQVRKAIESVIRDIIGGSTLEFRPRDIQGVTVSVQLFPYQMIGIGGSLPVKDSQGVKKKIAALYLKVAGAWYRVNFDMDATTHIRGTVDLVDTSAEKGLFPATPIGWVQQKSNGLYDYYSSAADIQTENYEHPDLTETVMKLAVVHEAAIKKQGQTGPLFG